MTRSRSRKPADPGCGRRIPAAERKTWATVELQVHLLTETARLFAAPLPYGVILRKFVSLIRGNVRAGAVLLFLREEGEKAYRLRATEALPRGVNRRVAVPEDDGLLAPIVRTGRPLLIEDPAHDRRCRPSALGAACFAGARGLLLLPILMRGRVNGVLAVAAPRQGPPFAPAVLDWFLPVAEQLSLALEKAILTQRLIAENERRLLVNQLAATLMTTFAPGPLVTKSLREVGRLLRAGGVSLLRYDETREELGFASTAGPDAGALKELVFKPGQGLAGWVFSNRQPVLVPDVHRDRRFWSRRDALTGRPTTSLMAVPLLARGKVLGVIEAVNRWGGGAFTETDLKFMEMLAAVVAIAFDNSLLYQRLTEAGRVLEATVRERTAALRDSNRALKATLGEIRQLTRFNEEIVNGLASALVTLDQEGRVLSLNPPARTVLGLGRRLPGARIADLFGGEFAAALLEQLRAGAGSIARAEGAVTLRRGGQKIIGYSVSSLRLPQGEQGWIMLFRDITDSKRLESEIRRLDRLVSLGEISANVAHELKNPLTVMYANMDWLLEKVPEEHRHRVQIVIDHMERMEKIIARMGILAKDQPLARKALDFRELITQMLAFLDKTLREKKIEVKASLPASPLRMEGDPAQLQQALLNIFMNAIQAMGVGGTLAVRLRSRALGGRPRLVLAVSDTGPGIPPHVLQRIFEPFFSTKETGTGLGLAITQQIIESHAGTIAAANRPGGGAIFKLTFPATPMPKDT